MRSAETLGTMRAAVVCAKMRVGEKSANRIRDFRKRECIVPQLVFSGRASSETLSRLWLSTRLEIAGDVVPLIQGYRAEPGKFSVLKKMICRIFCVYGGLAVQAIASRGHSR